MIMMMIDAHECVETLSYVERRLVVSNMPLVDMEYMIRLQLSKTFIQRI